MLNAFGGFSPTIYEILEQFLKMLFSWISGKVYLFELLVLFISAIFELSCEAYKHLGKATGSYWIDPDGSGALGPLKVHCNMTGNFTVTTSFSYTCDAWIKFGIYVANGTVWISG